MKKIIILLIAFLTVFSACRTPKSAKRAAQRKLQKALALDPTILSQFDTTVKGIAKGVAEVKVDGFEAETKAFTCDSLLKEIAKLNKANQDNKRSDNFYLYQDSLLDVIAKLNEKGELKIKTIVKDRLVKDTVKVPYAVKVKGKAIYIEKDKVFYRDVWFYAFLIVGVLSIALFIKKKDNSTIFVNNTTKDDGKKS